MDEKEIEIKVTWKFAWSCSGECSSSVWHSHLQYMRFIYNIRSCYTQLILDNFQLYLN
jgi:hypothetical protein